jgi:hypothetical protein
MSFLRVTTKMNSYAADQAFYREDMYGVWKPIEI